MIRNAKSCPEGLRVPAADLEKIVIEAIASKFRDRKWVSALAADLHRTAGDTEYHSGEMTASAHQTAIACAGTLAAQVQQQTVANSGILKTIISRVEVSKTAIMLRLDKPHIANMLRVGDSGRHQSSHRTETIDIKVTGQFLRCGKQVRLVLGYDTDDQPRPDQRLIEDVVRARQWFEDIASGRAASIAELAKRDKRSAPYISRKISLAFLAPDIIESIIDGSQPKSLTLEKLKKVCPLPLSWDEQRAIFLA